MDKYDEKAAKVTLAVATIFQMSLGKPSEENAEEVVAAALRESAAEAIKPWREAVQDLRNSIQDCERVEDISKGELRMLVSLRQLAETILLKDAIKPTPRSGREE